MADIVFVLGAGASAEGGAPVVNNFLDVAANLLRTKKVEKDKEHFERLQRVQGDLQRVHSKAVLDLENIEEIFSALEMGVMLRWLPALKSDDPGIATDSLKRVIVSTLCHTLKFTMTSKRGLLPPKPYDRFAEIIAKVTKESSRSVAILTLNYDLAIDFALHRDRLSPCYSLAENESGGIPLLKLHGSINWAKCVKCSAIIPWSMQDFFTSHQLQNWRAGSDTAPFYFNLPEHFGKFQHCGMPVIPEPVLVPPTWNKGTSYTQMPHVWARAGQELREAQHIYVIGYSLPPSDSFFRYLYAMGTTGPRPLRRLTVVDPNGGVHDRFRSLLGQGAAKAFRGAQCSFSDALETIEADFKN